MKTMFGPHIIVTCTIGLDKNKIHFILGIINWFVFINICLERPVNIHG